MEHEIETIREKLARRCGDRERVDLLNELSRLLRQYDLAESWRLAEEALALAKEGGYAAGEAVSRLRIGNCHRAAGEFDMARRHLEIAERGLEQFPELLPARMEVQRDTGLLHAAFGRLELALESYGRALLLAGELGDPISRAAVLAYKGMIHVRMFDYTRGCELELEALALARGCGDWNYTSLILQNIATIYITFNDYESAFQYLRQSLEALGDAAMPVRKALLLNQLGVVHRRRFDPAKALVYHQQALELFRQAGALEAVGATLADIGACHGDREEYEEALACFSEALAFAEREENDLRRGDALCGLGRTYFHLGRIEQALPALERGLAFARECHTEDVEAACCEYLFKIHEAGGDMARALEFHKQWAGNRLRREGHERLNAAALAELRMHLEGAEREREALRLRNEQLVEEMEGKARELTTMALRLVRNNEFIAHLEVEIREFTKEHGDAPLAAALMRKVVDNAHATHSWQAFEQQFEQVHHGFMSTLSGRYPALTPTELKICALLGMSLSNKQIGSLLSISDRTVDTHRASVRRKLGLGNGENLTSFLLGLRSKPPGL